jgi:hypothetical protein
MTGFAVRPYSYNYAQTPWTYYDVVERLGKRDRRKLENNTYLLNYGDYIGVRLHQTDVVHYYPDGRIVLNSGGWRTMTTKDRISKFSPVVLHSQSGNWFFNHNDSTYRFVDGVTLCPDGTVSGAGEITSTLDKQLKRAVKDYADFVAARTPLWKSSYACNECNQGEISHLMEHVSRKRVMRELTRNALIAAGASPAVMDATFNGSYSYLTDYARKCVAKAVYKFIIRKCGYAV